MILSMSPAIQVTHNPGSPYIPLHWDTCDSNGVPIVQGTLRTDGVTMYVMQGGVWTQMVQPAQILSCPELDFILEERLNEAALLLAHPELAEMRDKYLFMKKMVESHG